MSLDLKVLALVMAGGEGSRLQPLTADRCKPAVPFNGRHHLVDFVLSNLVNSEIYATHVLVQYKSQSLIDHVRRTWNMTRFLPDHFVSIVPPQMHSGTEWFQGTADAVSQNLHLIESFAPDLVAVFGADHVYRMDVRQMIAFHRQRRAQISVATLPVPVASSRQFGIVEADEDGRVRAFVEKPDSCRPMPGSRSHALASMGNYLFDTQVLLDALRAHRGHGHDDFGKHMLPAMLETHRLFAYDFATNVVPGIAPHEERGYWRDVGTIDAYFDAQFDAIGTTPKFQIGNPRWPIYASPEQAEPAQIESGTVRHSMIGAGCMVDGADLDRAILRGPVLVERGAAIESAIVMERCRIGQRAQIRRAIVDCDNDIPAYERIGFDAEADRQRFHVSDSGIVVVPAGCFPRRPAASPLRAPPLPIPASTDGAFA